MDEKSSKRFLIINFITLVLFAVLVYKLNCFAEFPFKKKNHFLIIGILSAQENFQQRLSIRKTWLQLLPEISSSAYFIIGKKFCEVPPYDRADPYSCVDKPFVLPENVTDLTEFTTMKIENGNSRLGYSTTGVIGFGFYIRSSITVLKLGILKQLLLLLDKEIQVKLISASDNKVIGSVSFNSELLSECNSSVLTKAIKPVRLNADFEGLLKLETKDVTNKFLPECSFAKWENEPYIINFIQLWQDGSVIPQPFNENSCTYVFMSYTVIDTKTIKLHISNRTSRLKEWHKSSEHLSFNLKNESEVYNDIFFVDVIDVYRNLSQKLNNFYERLLKTEHFHYILKADDDSFIDVLRIYEHLKQIHEKSENETSIRQINYAASNFWWWSYFKEFWKVERSGKWRENHYQSASYPTFPCGGGYIINKKIVEFIAENNHLNHFQGEDVSLGIWLSTQPVIQYKTPKVHTKNSSYELQKRIITKFRGEKFWEYFKMNKTMNEMASDLCEWTCSNKKYLNLPLCNKVQLSIENMYAVWNDYIKKGFL